MVGFKALNIESDDESDIEIDDTKELQIEDALKLYQTALKHHAEGPESYDLAAEAYEELFQSDIFKYPESQIELRRIELYGPATDTDDIWRDDFSADAVVVSGGLEAGPSTLAQILHLSHKNYAQFKLEYLTARLNVLHVTLNQILSDASTALDHFVTALDKDDSDLDLWRRTASVGEMLDSKRIARFCLEAVLDGDDEAIASVLSIPGLDEGLAVEQLRGLVARLEDQLSVLQNPMLVGKRKVISRMLKQRLESYQRISDYETALRQHERVEQHQPSRKVLKPPSTWAEVGEMLLRQLMAEQHGTSGVHPATAIGFEIETTPQDASSGPPSPMLQIEARPAPSRETTMPSTINEQFPGLDEGQPTAQPHIAPVEADMATVDSNLAGADAVIADEPAISLPTRKRSGDTAGINDGTEEGRTKSKRTRLRESNTAEDSRQAIIDANIQWQYEQEIIEIQAADDWMFETVGNLFERVGVVGFESGRNVRQELQSPGELDRPLQNGVDDEVESLKLAKNDLQAFLQDYSDKLAKVLVEGGEDFDLGQSANVGGVSGSMSNGTVSRGTTKPPLFSNNGVSIFLRQINHDWLLTEQIAWRWICLLLRPSTAANLNTYRKYLWPEDLKTMIVRTLVNFDESFVQDAKDELEAWKASEAPSDGDDRLAELVQTIFELHLDIYSLIKEPNSGVDAATVVQQRDRLQRWSGLACEAMHFRSISRDASDLSDDLSVRFLWATTFHLSAASDVSQDHVIECMNDLRGILLSLDDPHIQLQNNAIMPELSLAALDREVSRLSTRDFFLKVTTQDRSDPVATIENLEPLLIALEQRSERSLPNDFSHEEEDQSETQVSLDLIRFLQSSDLSVRMLLWKHLRDAYLAIDYKPMVVSCYFNMMRMLLAELKSNGPTSSSQHERQVRVLKVLRLIYDMTAEAWAIVQKSTDAFECIDEDALKKAVSVFGEVLQLMQVFNVSSDSIRIGQSQPPTAANGSEAPTFEKLNTRIHETQVYTWLILYSLLREAVFQFHELFPNPAEDMFDFLRVVHRNLGLRRMCGTKNKIFVHTLKDEFLSMTHIEGYDSEQAQVLYDLYGLNCFLNPSYELIEHHCKHDAFIEKSVALQAVDLLLQQASKLPTKDLIKHPIKETIEKVHGAAPRKKPTEAILRNREIYRSFLRSPIDPLDLFNCLKGEGNSLTISYVPKEDAMLASKGWYFLMGHLALARFRSQKRTAPTPTEDVDIAIAFFMQDLEYSMDKWETWFRLAQAYDTKIEESVVWSAEKLNNSMSEIVQLQRAAIHCYTMATALAYRSADLDDETSEKMTEMFIEFATRLYASSREPFSMLPFAREDQEKFLNLDPVAGVSKSYPYQSLRVYAAWKLAKVLYQRALRNRTQSWTLHFMLGKCLWKMHAASPYVKGPSDIPPSAQQVLASFIKAIELIPDERRKDSREKREPVLEPHYKLVSIVHKFVIRGELNLEDAREALSSTPYARTATFPKQMDEWVPHILTVLKTLRAADKSNWHHRMIARAAQIVYDDSDDRADPSGPSQNLGAMGAKHELTQQMFTKTMVLQVWRPDSERAGRHFVYTARYTRFFVQILEQLKDRTNLEQLARRVRRRPHDVFEHSSVWQDICHAYLKLLRTYAGLPEGLETSTFSNIAHEDFLARKEPLEKWMQSQESGTSPPLDVLREVQELKKINQSLMKPGSIDDLIGDAYAYIFNTIGRQLWDDELRMKREEEANRPPPPPISPPRNPMMSLTHLMNIDGTNETASIAHPQPSAAAAPPQPDQAPVRRKIGVGRREIRTCAEACFQKAQTAASSTSQSSKLPLSYPRVQVVIETSGVHAGDASVDTSAPGSIHDSADDESELSELEEEGEDDEEESGVTINGDSRPRLMFPGLASNEDSREASEGYGAIEEETGPDEIDVDMTEDRSNVEDNAVKTERSEPQLTLTGESQHVDKMEE